MKHAGRVEVRLPALFAVVVVATALLAAAAAGTPVALRPPCGAAARDPGSERCPDPRRRLAVVPSPAMARRMLNAPCTFIEHRDQIHVCEFGVPAAQASGTVALLGDSHASHWRAALEVVAPAERWRGVSITQTSCPLSKAVRQLKERSRSEECVRWRREVYPWLSQHPEITTVFVSQLAGGTGVVAGGRDELAVAVEGYLRAWRALPRSVRRIVVLRDTPTARPGMAACVERAIARRRRAGPACALRRSTALEPDPAAIAAARLRSRRVRVVDLTRFFCGRRLCYPVIGGVLVYKDGHHMTTAFASSLGPYLRRALR